MQQQQDNLEPLKPGFVITGLKPYFNARAKLPNKRFPVTCKHVELPLCDPEIIKKVINNTLAEIEGVRGEYDEKKFMWILEYGTKPIELTIDKSDYKLKRIIEHKKYAALMAASIALEKFPLNDEFFEDDGELPSPIPICSNGKWSNLQIYLTYDDEKNVILVEFNRYNGDHTSFYVVANIVERVLKEPTLINWIKRVNYLMFCEGIEYEPKNHILKYLCDDIVKREICSYL
jgi:hypothetical protein